MAQVQVVNFATSIGTADFYLGSVKVAADVSLNTGTAAFEVSASPNTTVSVALGGSVSASDALVTSGFSMAPNGKYLLVLYDGVNGATAAPALGILDNSDIFSGDPANAEVAFSHFIPNAPAMNVLLRSGGMIVGDLAFGGVASNIDLSTTDHFLDIKASGTTTILGTYRLSLQGYEGRIRWVFMTGSIQSNNTLKLYTMDDDGFVFPVDAAPVARVQFINALPVTVDIFKNGTRFADNAQSGTAMEFKYIPAGLPMNIAICDSTSLTAQNAWGTTNFTFQNMVAYTAIAGGDPQSPSMFLHHGSREVATDSNAVEVLFFNGLSNHPLIDLQYAASGSVLFDNVAYGTFSEYQAMPLSGATVVAKEVMTGATLLSVNIPDLQAYKGKALVVLLLPATTDGVFTAVLAAPDGSTQAVPTNTVGANEQVEAQFPSPVGNLVQEEILFSQKLTDEAAYQYRICALGGQVAQQGRLKSGNPIQVRNLSAGMYLLQLSKDNGQSIAFKFIKI